MHEEQSRLVLAELRLRLACQELSGFELIMDEALQLDLLDVGFERLLLDCFVEIAFVLSVKGLKFFDWFAILNVFLLLFFKSNWCNFFGKCIESKCHFLRLALHGGVPVVLDGVVSAALEYLSHLSPLVWSSPMEQE